MNNKNVTANLCLVAACAFSMSAMADRSDYAIEGFLGKSDQSNSVEGFQTLSGSDSSKGLRGVFAINQVIDLEIGYTDFGKAEDSGLDEFGDLITDTLDTTAVQVGIKGSIPLGRKVYLTGRAGVALWELDYRQTDSAFPGDAYTDSDEGTDPYFGVGLKVNLEDNIYLGVDYSSLDFTAALGDASTDHQISTFAVSLGISF